MATSQRKVKSINSTIAMRFILLFGVVSCFADMTYEGARSITGPYLATLGASAFAVAFIAGFGELLGYTLRMVSGFWVDRTHRYWLITSIGYVVNLLAVPALALTHHWITAAVLIILERTGKAIRVPARDTMLSYAAEHTGMGRGFGIHESLDQIGAMSGPLFVGAILYFHSNYHHAFAFLLIPALISLSTLFITSRLYKQPKDLGIAQPKITTENMPSVFWWYLIGAALIAAGYADFPLIAFHFETAKILTPTWIPISYAAAMSVSAISAYTFGHTYDRFGFKIIIIATLMMCLFAPLVFLGNAEVAIIGMLFWGLGMGAQASLIKAAVANMVPTSRRGAAFGIFNLGYGVSWFLGSLVIGKLYEFSIPAVVIFSVFAQLAAVPVFVYTMRRLKK